MEERAVFHSLLITIDGPAGVGKSTVSKCLAKRLGYAYLDTGALYRALAWKIHQEQIDPQHTSQVEDLLSRTNMDLVHGPDGLLVRIDGQAVAQEHLRSPIISQLASSVASLPSVRAWLLPIQQKVGRVGKIVAEGRDMGTRVFPKADVKFFLDAELEVRARRRHKEQVQKGESLDLPSVQKEMEIRDKRDRNRTVDPLRPAPEANIIDTSHQTIEEVVGSMLSKIRELA